jgi:hypothetical protein
MMQIENEDKTIDAQKEPHGYCRGQEKVRFVKRIRTDYDILKREAIR